MNIFLKIAIFVAIGALLGYGYYYFWGCTESCAIRSDWLTMTAYGAAVGLVVGLPTKKKKVAQKAENSGKDGSDS